MSRQVLSHVAVLLAGVLAGAGVFALTDRGEQRPDTPTRADFKAQTQQVAKLVEATRRSCWATIVANGDWEPAELTRLSTQLCGKVGALAP